jgi:hypothetical protein
MKISYGKFNTNLKNCFGCLLFTGSHQKYITTPHLCLKDGCEARIEYDTFDSCGSGGDRIIYPCEIRECPILEEDKQPEEDQAMQVKHYVTFDGRSIYLGGWHKG